MTFDSTVYCGECWHCRRGEINLCDNRRVLGVSCDEYRRHGAFAEYVAVPHRILCRIPDGSGSTRAAMAEPLAVAFHAVALARPWWGNRQSVVGAGMIGLLIIQVAEGRRSLSADRRRRGRREARAGGGVRGGRRPGPFFTRVSRKSVTGRTAEAPTSPSRRWA